jgi:hypothetical protein
MEFAREKRGYPAGRSVIGRIALILVSLLAAAAVAVATSTAADSAPSSSSATYRTLGSGMLVGFYDDEQVYGRTDWAFRQLRSLRAGIVRITIEWAKVAKRRPSAPADPADPAYNWTAVDNVMSQAALNKVRVLATIYGTPRWAGVAQNRLPRRVVDLRLFAHAAARRYSGTYSVKESENEPARRLPAVRHWLAWNEPNNPVFPPQRREGRLRRHRSPWERRTTQLSTVHLAARLPDLAAPGEAQALRRLRAPPVLRQPLRATVDGAAVQESGHAREHRSADQTAQPSLRAQQAALDHGVRLPDQPARRELRRPVLDAGEIRP